MEKTLVIGASGKIGQLLLPLLISSNIPVVAMVRDSNKLVPMDGVEIVEADIEGEFGFALKNCNRVIFSAGSGATTGLDKTFLVDLWGARKAIDYAKATSIQHFVMISSRGADNPDKGPTAIKPYLIAKHFADEYLVNSGVTYTILRPGRLTDDDGQGLITSDRPNNPEEQAISRIDTARVVLHCLKNPAVKNKIYELYKGDSPINRTIV